MIVLKFGGSSVADREQIEKVLEIVRARTDRRPFVVTSAHRGITNALVSVAREAARGVADVSPVVHRQREIARALGCDDDVLDPLFAELTDLVRGLALVKELSPRSLDYISSFGERMSSRVLADFFGRNGLRAHQFDAWELGFVTNSEFGSARPRPGWETNAKRLVAALDPDEIPVVTGFIGKDESGEITTVGRNGSDFTATLFAAAIGAEEVQIWTDTDGVMTGDPSVVGGARNIPTMRFDEAAELAYFGSRVLHPATLVPAIDRDVPVRVLNTNRPHHPGTVISSDPAARSGRVTSIAYKEDQSVLVIRTPRMFGRPGFLAEVLAVVAKDGVDLDMIATSEISVAMTSANADGLASVASQVASFGECELAHHKTILAVVGRELATRAGLGAEILGAMARVGVNVEMLSHARGSISFSMLIDDGDIEAAVSALHEVLFEADA
jgi:aspartate kinase